MGLYKAACHWYGVQPEIWLRTSWPSHSKELRSISSYIRSWVWSRISIQGQESPNQKSHSHWCAEQNSRQEEWKQVLRVLNMRYASSRHWIPRRRTGGLSLLMRRTRSMRITRRPWFGTSVTNGQFNFNFYCHWDKLVVRESKGSGHFLHIK